MSEGMQAPLGPGLGVRLSELGNDYGKYGGALALTPGLGLRVPEAE